MNEQAPVELTRQEIGQGFADLGLKAGDVVLLHSSLRRFGQVAGGARTVIEGLLDVLGKAGTLVVPTLTGNDDFNPENPPHIDMRTEPSYTGCICETLRQMEGAVRSIHPTHSCAAIGPRAVELMRDHYKSPTPWGILSPFFRVAQAGGYIVMAGCDLTCCTTLHTVEELANVGYVCQPQVSYGTCIDFEGNCIETPCRLYSFQCPDRDFPVLEPLLIERGLMRIGKVGESEVRVIHSMGLIETALDQIRFNPLYLTTRRHEMEGLNSKTPRKDNQS